MSTATTKKVPGHQLRATLPTLEAGDRLTRAEFERRYEAMPGVKKAELIDGVVYMPSPFHYRQHGEPHLFINGWLAQYVASTPGVRAADNATVRLDQDNEFQPDALLLIDPKRGGLARISDDDYIEGPPELVVEVASSSVGIDLHAKLNVYRRAGVPEHVVWRVRDGAIDWFNLIEGRYEPQSPGTDGFHQSAGFPGLRLDASALLAGDLARTLDVLRQGIATPEHAAFVQRLGG